MKLGFWDEYFVEDYCPYIKLGLTNGTLSEDEMFRSSLDLRKKETDTHE